MKGVGGNGWVAVGDCGWMAVGGGGCEWVGGHVASSALPLGDVAVNTTETCLPHATINVLPNMACNRSLLPPACVVVLLAPACAEPFLAGLLLIMMDAYLCAYVLLTPPPCHTI